MEAKLFDVTENTSKLGQQGDSFKAFTFKGLDEAMEKVNMQQCNKQVELTHTLLTNNSIIII